MSISERDRAFLAQFATHPKQPSSHTDYHQVARQAAEANGFDADVFTRQIQQESGFNPKAVSSAGARGIAQIMPDTARGWGVDPNDPVASLKAAAKNMASYKRTYLRKGYDDGTATKLALAAYNAGPGAVAKYGTRIIEGKTGVSDYDGQTYHYVSSITGGKSSGKTARGNQGAGDVPAGISPGDRAFLSQFAARPLPQITNPSIYANDDDPLPEVLVNGPPDITPDLQSIQSLRVPDLKLPTAVQAPSSDRIGDLALAQLNQPRPAAPPTPGIIEGLGNIANQVGSGIGQGFNAVKDAVTNPGALINQAGQTIQNEAQNTNSPLDTVGGLVGGGIKAVADMGNSVLALPSDLQNAYMGRKVSAPSLQIPTGGLEDYLKNKGASSFVGGLLPFVAAEVLSGGAATPEILAATRVLKAAEATGDIAKVSQATNALKALKVAEEAKRASLAGRAGNVAKSGGVGAGFGFFSHPGDLAERSRGAVEMGALGTGLGAAGEAFSMAAKRLFPGKVAEGMTEAEIKTVLTPEELARVEVAGKLNPEQMKADPKQLTQEFKDRGGEVPGSVKGNLDAQILGPDGKPITVESSRLKSSFETALERSKGLDLAQPETPRIEIPGGIPNARAEVAPAPKPNITNPITGKPYPDLAGKSAKDSFGVIERQADDIATAEQLRNEAVNNLKAQAENIQNVGGSADLVEAQRAVGSRINELEQKAASGEISQVEAQELQSKRTALNSLLSAQRELNSAESLAAETQAKTPRTEVGDLAETPKAAAPVEPVTGLPSSIDLAMKRAEDLVNSEAPGAAEPRPAEVSRPRVGDLSRPPAGERLIQTSADLARKPTKEGVLVSPGDLANPAKGRVLEFPNKPQTAERLEIVGPSGQPVKRPAEASGNADAGAKILEPDSGGYSFSSASGDGMADVLKPDMAPEIIKQAVAAKGGQLINIVEAQQFVKKYMPQQMQHLLNIVQSAKQDQTIAVTHRPIGKGGEVINAREVSPVGIEKRTISGKREVTVMREDGMADTAIRDNLVQRLSKAGIKVNAKQQAIEGVNPRTATARLNSMAQMLPEHERTHIYVYDHNFGDTARGQAHGVRRLDRITESSLTGNKQELPTGSEYQNQIAPTFKALDDLINAPDTPEAFKKVIKQLGEGKIGKQGFAQLKSVLGNLPKDMVQKLCRL